MDWSGVWSHHGGIGGVLRTDLRLCGRRDEAESGQLSVDYASGVGRQYIRGDAGQLDCEPC